MELEHIVIRTVGGRGCLTSEIKPEPGSKLLILRDGLLWGKKGDVCTYVGPAGRNRCQVKKHKSDTSMDCTFTAECSIKYAIEQGDVIPIIAFCNSYVDLSHQG
jgi:hypothetical protein